VFDRIDHVAIAVEAIEPALPMLRDTFGMPVVHREIVEEQGVEALLLDVGENHIELLAPLGEDTPVGRFLKSRGAGLHHVAYQVADIDHALEELKASGVRLIDESPRSGIRNSRVAFVHPSASSGVLTELVQPAAGH
jgi:methylmalonyl-CoA epimerase